MNIEINKEDLKEIVSPEFLAEVLADKIIQNKTDKNWNEFDSELLKAIRESVKRIVDEVMLEYREESRVKVLVENVLKNMTKEEIIKVLT